jgi:hypothetical protein
MTPIPTTSIQGDLQGSWYLSTNNLPSYGTNITYNGIINIFPEKKNNGWWTYQWIGKTLDNKDIIRFYATENKTWYGFTTPSLYDPGQWIGWASPEYNYMNGGEYIGDAISLKRVYLRDNTFYTYDNQKIS